MIMDSQRDLLLAPWESEGCLLCDVLEGQPWVPFRTIFSIEESPNETIYETNAFKVILDIGPVAEGHCLIIHKSHIPSMACSSDDNFKELHYLKDILFDALKNSYGESIAFEHGSASFSRNAGCCIDHAHLHVVPSGKDIFTFIDHDYNFHPVIDDDQIKKLAYQQGYLYYEDTHRTKYIYETNRAPSQYFRRVLSHALGQEYAWNWRDHVRYPHIFRTKEKIRRAREVLAPLLKTKG